MVSGRMVLQEVEVSQIINVLKNSFVPVFTSVVQFDVGWSAFLVRKNKLSSYVSTMLW